METFFKLYLPVCTPLPHKVSEEIVEQIAKTPLIPKERVILSRHPLSSMTVLLPGEQSDESNQLFNYHPKWLHYK